MMSREEAIRILKSHTRKGIDREALDALVVLSKPQPTLSEESVEDVIYKQMRLWIPKDRVFPITRIAKAICNLALPSVKLPEKIRSDISTIVINNFIEGDTKLNVAERIGGKIADYVAKLNTLPKEEER